MGEGPDDLGDLVPRIGTFLILLGVFALIIFIASLIAKETGFDWLLASVLLLGIGIYLSTRSAPPPSSGRFGAIRRLREGAKKRKEKKDRK